MRTSLCWLFCILYVYAYECPPGEYASWVNESGIACEFCVPGYFSAFPSNTSFCTECGTYQTSPYYGATSCFCIEGFALNPEIPGTCVDQDECIAPINATCANHSTCVNAIGSYLCVCNFGYTSIYSPNQSIYFPNATLCEPGPWFCETEANNSTLDCVCKSMSRPNEESGYVFGHTACLDNTSAFMKQDRIWLHAWFNVSFVPAIVSDNETYVTGYEFGLLYYNHPEFSLYVSMFRDWFCHQFLQLESTLDACQYMAVNYTNEKTILHVKTQILSKALNSSSLQDRLSVVTNLLGSNETFLAAEVNAPSSSILPLTSLGVEPSTWAAVTVVVPLVAPLAAATVAATTVATTTTATVLPFVLNLLQAITSSGTIALVLGQYGSSFQSSTIDWSSPQQVATVVVFGIFVLFNLVKLIHAMLCLGQAFVILHCAELSDSTRVDPKTRRIVSRIGLVVLTLATYSDQGALYQVASVRKALQATSTETKLSAASWKSATLTYVGNTIWSSLLAGLSGTWTSSSFLSCLTNGMGIVLKVYLKSML